MTWLAYEIGLTPSNMHYLLSGHHNMRDQHVNSIAAALNLEETEVQQLKDLYGVSLPLYRIKAANNDVGILLSLVDRNQEKLKKEDLISIRNILLQYEIHPSPVFTPAGTTTPPPEKNSAQSVNG